LRNLADACCPRKDAPLGEIDTSAANEFADQIRPVTVLFADIVGSTALGERLPPDQIKVVIGEAVGEMGAAVERFGGTVQAYMGDGVCAYFGVPLARRDDAERAALAALHIRDQAQAYALEMKAAWGIDDFNVRVGINSGRAGVGPIGEGRANVALGDVANVAARIEAAASPGTVLVGQSCARQLSRRFVLGPFHEISARGREKTVPVAPLLGIRPALMPETETLVVGRALERRLLSSVADDLAVGRGGALLLSGDPGIGKTRLVAELRSVVAGRALWLQGQCASYGGIFPYQPLVELVRDWIGVGAEEVPISIRLRLRAKLAEIGLQPESLLGRLTRLLTIEPRTGSDDSVPPGAEVRETFTSWLSALTDKGPVVVAIEDIQWADPSSLELIDMMLELTDAAPLQFVTTLHTSPPPHVAQWRARTLTTYEHRVREVRLSPLTREESAALLDAVSERPLDTSTAERILERAEGNPLFIRQLLHSMDDSPVRTESTWTFSASPARNLPEDLLGLLIARIDALPRELRETLQVAGVIGRDFSLQALEAVTGADCSEKAVALLRAGIIREVRRYPEMVYSFSNTLLHEAVLSTLTSSQSRRMYERVGDAFEKLENGESSQHLERLAFYFYRSDSPQRALPYLEQSGARALSLGAEAQAAHLWRRGLKLAQRIHDVDATTRLHRRLTNVSSDLG
jgi:class 3 adenylate cyclase